MDPWASPSPWAEEVSAESSAADVPSASGQAEPASTTAATSSSPIKLKLDNVDHDPWATSSTIAADARKPSTSEPEGMSTSTHESSPAAHKPASSPVVNSNASSGETWVDEGASAWGGAPPEPRSVSSGLTASDATLPQTSRPASPARSGSALGADGTGGSVAASWEAGASIPDTGGWGGESADPWGADTSQAPATSWHANANSEASPNPSPAPSPKNEQSHPAAAEQTSNDVNDQESVRQEATSSAAQPISSRMAAAFSSWRRPNNSNTSSIQAAEPSVTIPASKQASSSTADVTAPSNSAKPAEPAKVAQQSQGPGWAHVSKKSEAGIAARFSGLFSGTTGALGATPKVESAAEEDEEAQHVDKPYEDRSVPPTATVDIFGDSKDTPGTQPAPATTATAGIARWLRWGRKEGKPPPEGMTADDLEWLESLPPAPQSSVTGVKTADGADDLESWLGDAMASRAAASAARRPLNAQPLTSGSTFRIETAARGGNAPLKSSPHSRASPQLAPPPRLAGPPAAAPRWQQSGVRYSIDDSGGEEDDYQPPRRSNSLVGSTARGAPGMAATQSAGKQRQVKSSAGSNSTSRTGDSNDLLGDFDTSWEVTAPSGNSRPEDKTPNTPGSADLSGSLLSDRDRSATKATIGSGRGRGRYAQRITGLAGSRKSVNDRRYLDSDEEDYEPETNVDAQQRKVGRYSDDPSAKDDDSWDWATTSSPQPHLWKDTPASPPAPALPPKLAQPLAFAPASARSSLEASAASSRLATATPPLRSGTPQSTIARSSTSTPPILAPPPPATSGYATAGGRVGSLLPPPPPPSSRSAQRPATSQLDLSGFTAAPPSAAPRAQNVAAGFASTQQGRDASQDSKAPGLSQADLSFFDSL
ncbi:hypothetical protein IE81DRAFT_98623 [Ceraceosorus guamensis]|uniref:Uncharacterized protein n=1 Tax=Ceraceosorus guamensis TaxID=1522189 RepID=A0A316W255_9BASI|nr:hypothetical protein IE81DRAFT_98623 [Ceraceosorus guamensis]PWN43168.1 hypothetical protein IE81DRAFT_98623 [Ceraceosorus guamensis]